MFKRVLITMVLASAALILGAPGAQAGSDGAAAGGLAFLRASQGADGKISGYGGESQWAAIAFAAEGADTAGVIIPNGVSLEDFLLESKPADGAAATDLERQILAIVATGGNPGDFGGVNYIASLQALAHDGQIGEPSQLNDDIFGLLALEAGGPLADPAVEQNALDFIVAHQTADGGYSWSADGSCAWCGADSNDTAAAIQALQAARQAGLANASLDAAIESAKQYLLTARKGNGGFGYDANTDADGSSTAWALMALNALGLQNSTEALEAAAWLEANQTPDGGFYWMAGNPSDTYTTSHAVIALAGKSWLLKAYVPAAAADTAAASGSDSTTGADLTSNTGSTDDAAQTAPASVAATDTAKTAPHAVAVAQTSGTAVLGAESIRPEATSTTRAPTTSPKPAPSILGGVNDSNNGQPPGIPRPPLALLIIIGVAILIIGLKMYERRVK